MVILPYRPDRARAFASRAIVLRGNKVIFNNVRFRHPDAWKGLFSQCSFSGCIVSFVRTYLGLLNIPDTVFVLFLSDGDIRADSVEQVLQAAQLVGANRPATVLVATLAQTSESAELRYVYMPLDDRVFRHGIRHVIPTSSLPEWGDRSFLPRRAVRKLSGSATHAAVSRCRETLFIPKFKLPDRAAVGARIRTPGVFW